jgi:hypothetical protein
MNVWPIVALVALIAVAVGAIFIAGRRSAYANAKKAAAESEVEAAKRITDAQANAPSDRDALVERLRDGSRDL